MRAHTDSFWSSLVDSMRSMTPDYLLYWAEQAHQDGAHQAESALVAYWKALANQRNFVVND